jgi:translation initiation factor IF-2
MNLVDRLVEVNLPNKESFLKVKETLTRIGIASKKEQKLYQSCHILHKQGKYYIVHFKELFMLDGKITRNNKIRLIRDGIVIYSGLLGSLKRFKDDVKEVAKGYECGLNIDKFNDLQVGDQIEAFEEVEVKQTL